MRVITIKRTVRRKRSIGQLADLSALERRIEFAIEALLFGVLLTLSAWPIAQAAAAMNGSV